MKMTPSKGYTRSLGYASEDTSKTPCYVSDNSDDTEEASSVQSGEVRGESPVFDSTVVTPPAPPSNADNRTTVTNSRSILKHSNTNNNTKPSNVEKTINFDMSPTETVRSREAADPTTHGRATRLAGNMWTKHVTSLASNVSRAVTAFQRAPNRAERCVYNRNRGLRHSPILALESRFERSRNRSPHPSSPLRVAKFWENAKESQALRHDLSDEAAEMLSLARHVRLATHRRAAVDGKVNVKARQRGLQRHNYAWSSSQYYNESYVYTHS